MSILRETLSRLSAHCCLALLTLGLLTGAATASAKDCELEIQYRKSTSSSATSVSVTGANKGETKSISRNNLRFLKNKKSRPVQAEISKNPGSSQRHWITLYANNQKHPTTGYFAPGIKLFKVKCPVSTPTSAASNAASCPIGPNGKVCSGTGNCSPTNGQCSCNEDYSGNACQTLSQRCYGAIGNNCGAGDGFTNFGLCAGGRCKINAGSWEHDECCVTYRKHGPSPTSQQGSCTPPPMAQGPYASNCITLFNKAVKHLANPALTWERQVDFQKKRSGVGSFSVTHADMCNKPGGTLSCSDSQYCCSKRSTRTAVRGICKCR